MQDQSENINTSQEPSAQSWNPIRDYLILILFAGGIIALDTWTKVLVDNNIPVGGAWLPKDLVHYLAYFRVTHIHNTGTAFSMFAGAEKINLIVSILAFAVAAFIIIIFPRIDRSETALRAAIILQLGGTVGNLISRITYGYVLDFISIGNFAVFNIADASLVTGASLMVLAVLIEEIKERKQVPEPPDPDDRGVPVRHGPGHPGVHRAARHRAGLRRGGGGAGGDSLSHAARPSQATLICKNLCFTLYSARLSTRVL